MISYIMMLPLVLTTLISASLTLNAIGRYNIVQPLQCQTCESFLSHHNAAAHGNNNEKYTSFNDVYVKKHGDVIIGGLFPIKYRWKDEMRYANIALVEAMIWTIEQINEDNNILPGIEIGYEIRDTMNIGAFASVLALELAARNSVAIVGPGSSEVAAHIASLLGSLNYPLISFASTSNVLSNTDRFSMFARTVPSDVYQCRAIKDLILHYQWTYVSILYSPHLYGVEGAANIKRLLENEGSCIDKYIQLNDIDNQVDGITEGKEVLMKTFSKPTNDSSRLPAHVVILFTTNQYARQILESAIQLKAEKWNNGESENFWDNVTWVAPESWSLKTEIIGLIYEHKLGNFIGVTPTTIPVPEFVNYYKSLKPNVTRNPWFAEFYEKCNGDVSMCGQYSYHKQGVYEESVIMAVEVIARTLDGMVGGTHNASSLDDCLKPSKPVKDNTDLYFLRNSVIGSCIFNNIISNKYTTKDEDRTRASITRSYMSFNKSNGDFEAIYSFITFKKAADGSIEMDEFGSWNKSLTINSKRPFKYGEIHRSMCSLDCPPGSRQIRESKRCCWTCERCQLDFHSENVNSRVCIPCRNGSISNEERTGCIIVPPSFLTYNHPAAMILIFLAAFGCLLTLFTIVVFIRYGDTPIVKASSKELCIVMLCGVFTGFLSSLLSLGQPTDRLCMVHLCLGSMFGSLTIIPLFLKVTRVFSLFFQSKRKNGNPPQYLLPIWQSLICFLLVLVQITILIVVSILFPLKAKKKYPDRSTVLIACEGETGYDTILSLSLPVIYVLFFMALSTIMSYLVRKLPSNFQEAKFICLAQIISIITLTAFVPAYFTSRGIWQTFSVAMATQICAYSILILIFFKKVNIILLYPERNKVVLTRGLLRSIDMTRDDRRKSFLKSQRCHMCGHTLAPGMSYKIIPGGEREVVCKEPDCHDMPTNRFKIDTSSAARKLQQHSAVFSQSSVCDDVCEEVYEEDTTQMIGGHGVNITDTNSKTISFRF